MTNEPKSTPWDTRAFMRAINEIERIRDNLEEKGMLVLGDHSSLNFGVLIASLELDLEGFVDANANGKDDDDVIFRRAMAQLKELDEERSRG